MPDRVLRSFCLAITLALPLAARAQEVPGSVLGPWTDLKWRSDYNAARKEALDKNLPLVIDFGTASCFYCKKMDETTFRDPRIVTLMNERCVPLKIDPERDVHTANLANFLRIESYPTIVLATPDGKLLPYIKGYQDSETFHEVLLRFTGNVQAPDSFQRDLQLAAQKMQLGEYSVAIPMLRGIIDNPKGRALHTHAQKFLDAIELKAMERLDTARDLHDKGRAQDAVAYLADTGRYFPGLEATRRANDLMLRMKDQAGAEKTLVQRTARAKELLVQARESYKQRDLVPCVDRVAILLRDFADLPEGQEALQIMGELKSNPVLLQQAADTLSERLGETYLALAESHLQKGQQQRAEYFFQRVLLASPGSRIAETAQTRLAQIQSVRPGGTTGLTSSGGKSE